MTNKNNMQRLLSPKSIVMIGGSNLEQPIKNTRDIGFDGQLWIVNSKYEQISGIPCYPTLDDLPGVPDAAFVAVNAKASVDAVAALSAKGCGAAVCYAAGFSEVGAEGEQLQQALVAAAGDMVLVGPNCYGVLNFTNGVALWPDRLLGEKSQSGVAILSQSGNVALNLTMQDRSLPITHVISVGNQAQLEVSDYIEPLLDDPRVKAIGFYVEGLKDVGKFSRAAVRAMQQGVPLVVLKAGSSEMGAQLAMSHTSSLSGSDDMYQAMFDRLGVMRVHSLSQLVETLKIASLCERPAGDRIGVLTCSGGDSAMLADALDQVRLPLPELGNELATALRGKLPGFASLSNPLDYNTSVWGDLAASTEVFSLMMQADYDATVLVLDFPRAGFGDDREWQVATDALIAAHARCPKTAVVISNFVELMPADARQRLVAAGIAPLQGTLDAVAALRQWVDYGMRVNSLTAEQLEQLPLRAGKALQGEAGMLDEWNSKQLVQSFGVNIPAGRKATLEQLPEALRRMQYPVVLKAVSNQLAHKTEAGAVALNLYTAEAVQQAAQGMAERLAGQGLHDLEYLVEPMVCDTVAELIIGLKRDEQFGLALILGTGGILVNLLNDSATLLLPTSREAVSQALHGLQGAPLLQGYRGREHGDIEAVIDTVMSVADLAMKHWDSIEELDINPLMVRPQGKGAVAVDALITLAQANEVLHNPVQAIA